MSPESNNASTASSATAQTLYFDHGRRALPIAEDGFDREHARRAGGEITLAPLADTPPHEHLPVPETCYCLEGELACHAEGEPTITLRRGEKVTFPAGSEHQLHCAGNAPCRFLLIHAGGPFNIVPTEER